MCIENDIRGNIKLSMKATLPQRGDQRKNPDRHDSAFPTKSSATAIERADDPSVSHNEIEVDGSDSSPSSTPSILIRSVAECDAQDISSGHKTPSRSGKVAKYSPRPYDSFGRSPSSSNIGSSKKKKETKDANKTMQESDVKLSLEAMLNVLSKKDATVDKPKSGSTTKVHVDSLKLGDRVTTIVYQIRTHGLVLELRGGLRGMYKFQANGKRDFEVGGELRVECSSFSSKGIPVFTLLEDE